jgi:hypothetical protein
LTDLSPAALAVMTAGTMGNSNVINDPVYRQCIAAALRAAIDQVVPEYRENRPKTFDEKHRKMDASVIRYCLLDIADELEGAQ